MWKVKKIDSRMPYFSQSNLHQNKIMFLNKCLMRKKYVKQPNLVKIPYTFLQIPYQAYTSFLNTDFAIKVRCGTND
jgi:hypothetical protein